MQKIKLAILITLVDIKAFLARKLFKLAEWHIKRQHKEMGTCLTEINDIIFLDISDRDKILLVNEYENKILDHKKLNEEERNTVLTALQNLKQNLSQTT